MYLLKKIRRYEFIISHMLVTLPSYQKTARWSFAVPVVETEIGGIHLDYEQLFFPKHQVKLVKLDFIVVMIAYRF